MELYMKKTENVDKKLFKFKNIVEIEEKINRNSIIPLKNSVQISDSISAFDKGNMPQGNIIIGDPLNVVKGFCIYK